MRSTNHDSLGQSPSYSPLLFQESLLEKAYIHPFIASFQRLQETGYLPKASEAAFAELESQFKVIPPKFKSFDVMDLLKQTNKELYLRINNKAILSKPEVKAFDAFIDGLDVGKIIKEVACDKQNFSILGIGSLIAPQSKSSERSISPKDAACGLEAIGFGFQRGFFHDSAQVPFEKNPYFENKEDFAKSLADNYFASIGMKPTGNNHDMATATLYPNISEQTFKNLLKREWGYCIVPVFAAIVRRSPCGSVRFEPRVSWTFQSKQQTKITHKAKPMRNYIDVCLEGADSLSCSKYSKQAWIETTVLADGTPLKNHLKFLRDTQTLRSKL